LESRGYFQNKLRGFLSLPWYVLFILSPDLAGACIWDVAANSNGDIVTASADNTVRLWNLSGEDTSVAMNYCISVVETTADLKMDANVAGENVFVGDGGVRCISFSPDERHLAFGDRCGNLHIYDTREYRQLASFPAHEGEVMTIDYSCPASGCQPLLATGGRDR
jgi:WD40 repeat protein